MEDQHRSECETLKETLANEHASAIANLTAEHREESDAKRIELFNALKECEMLNKQLASATKESDDLREALRKTTEGMESAKQDAHKVKTSLES